MSDDLAKKLRETTYMYQVDCELKMKCADRIEALEAENAELKAKLAWVETDALVDEMTFKEAQQMDHRADRDQSF